MTSSLLHPNSSPNLYNLSGFTNACFEKVGVTAYIGMLKRQVTWIANPEKIWRVYNFAIGSAILTTYLANSQQLSALEYLPHAVVHLHQAIFVHPESDEEFKRLGIFINAAQMLGTVTYPANQLLQVFPDLNTRNLLINYSGNLIHCCFTLL